MGVEDDGRVKGIKSKMVGRGGWVKGMMGFGKETGRGVWGSSGREEWSKVSPSATRLYFVYRAGMFRKAD
jgi:hypothetical protein